MLLVAILICKRVPGVRGLANGFVPTYIHLAPTTTVFFGSYDVSMPHARTHPSTTRSVHTHAQTPTLHVYERKKHKWSTFHTTTHASQIFRNYVFNDMGYGDLTQSLLSGGCAGIAEVGLNDEREHSRLVPIEINHICRLDPEGRAFPCHE